jgi:hypothetical protein
MYVLKQCSDEGVSNCCSGCEVDGSDPDVNVSSVLKQVIIKIITLH